ncbi:peptide ABC transporter ATP-binding protein [Alkalihalobacillus alcalophilus ATCC 27647 = CGMCC 1.3604]|uniref:Peptide ABC transporter ATP-binding protein n=2 Tax=Alkalihalobacillus alcalophilus ATCC 27647 = CGMCC 1.3604 TaxID=1218173 RepID=A0A094YRA4_ALKAL|nr:ABC transporter ATP-binding protein [Alkalihalobacillus alcalophilus]KGA96012.1 peptide ABC transporter ATP-binding protein [Alkalihalobacillus alcalophilus ATCC 27647 = CGMCC 1.3604]MED1562936.1 ABC transporter ATP-binding protein [Alkalihalobacillus alcalophilus]THG91944.1 peptide ABC transporter ATP-binding protein [Alkalihalobacillus alcalophilus ATCC 27647 = CGMCC 1.3604]
MENNQLVVKNLHVGFKHKKGFTTILNGVDFSVRKGETLCIVGESGCGKSLTSLSIMGLLPKMGQVSEGEILFDGQSLTEKTKTEMSKIRGNDISMIFQEPMTSLNPVHRVGKQIAEAIKLHQKVSKKEALNKAVEMLRLVGIPSPEERVYSYPHELSGGMRQRIMIAMALSCNPKLLIADEPTTALDVTIQAQILELMNSLKQEFNMSIIMITHDLGVVNEVADKVIVMYAGKVVEYSSVKSLFKEPLHPYTKGLIESIPKLDVEQKELPIIEGSVPNPNEMPKGCRFATRCPNAVKDCFSKLPPLISVNDNQEVSCWMYTENWNHMSGERWRDEEYREVAATR